MALIARGGTRVEEVKKKKKRVVMGGVDVLTTPTLSALRLSCAARANTREETEREKVFSIQKEPKNARHSSTVGSDVARIPNCEVVQKISPLFFALLFQKKYLYISKVFSHSLGIISTS